MLRIVVVNEIDLNMVTFLLIALKMIIELKFWPKHLGSRRSQACLLKSQSYKQKS